MMRMVSVLSATLALGSACASVPALIDDKTPPADAWAEVDLVTLGPEASYRKDKDCIEEARSAGIRIRPGAPIKANLYLAKNGNRVTVAGPDVEGVYDLGNWTARAVCRVAMAKMVNMDKRVKVSKEEPRPECKPLGGVEGWDEGFAVPGMIEPGSHEAAVAAAQFTARRRGADYITLDATREVIVKYGVNGRAFVCNGEPR